MGAAVRLNGDETLPSPPATSAPFPASASPPFKVPRNILIVDEIPLGPTGKPQRIGMAERLGLA